MRTQWYGDKRDLVKWGAMVHLCREHNLDTIVQVAFLQGSDEPDKFRVDGKQVKFPSEVWEHFRNLHHIQTLAKATGLKIEVLDGKFTHKERDIHLKGVCETLVQLKEPKAVLLDPDNGLEPEKADGKHVTVAEIRAIWTVLTTGDWLVLYQHAHRKSDWRKIRKNAFAKACGVKNVQMLDSQEIAHDVAFFAAEK